MKCMLSYKERRNDFLAKKMYPTTLTWALMARKGQALNLYLPDFPGGTVVKNPPANAGDTGSGPGLGRSHIPRSN